MTFIFVRTYNCIVALAGRMLLLTVKVLRCFFFFARLRCDNVCLREKRIFNVRRFLVVHSFLGYAMRAWFYCVRTRRDVIFADPVASFTDKEGDIFCDFLQFSCLAC